MLHGDRVLLEMASKRGRLSLSGNRLSRLNRWSCSLRFGLFFFFFFFFFFFSVI